MKYLKIQNKGLLDIRLVSLMGGSTKTNDKFKIGQFGTGLKYTLSYLIRNNISFKIFIGEQEIKIKTVTETIQNHNFDVLYINDERSSITSSMGLDWQGWMIVREIWCNALDEGGHNTELTENLSGKDGYTTFYIQNVGEIKETVENWNKYFLHNFKPIHETEYYAIYPASEKMRIYKQGVMIQEYEGKSIYSYDIKNSDINELREYKGNASYDLSNIISSLPKEQVEYFLSHLKEDVYEADIDYDWYGTVFKDSWRDALGQAKIICKKDLESLKSRGVEVNEESLIAVPPLLFKKLSTKFPSISAVRRADKVASFYEIHDEVLEERIKQCCAILESCNYTIDPELKFVFGHFGDKSTFAQISMDTKTIMFSHELKRKSLFDVCTTIIEENEHYATGHQDCTRLFQQHFINLFTKELLERNEVKL